MYSIINVDQWTRKKTFEYYQEFEDPFFNVCANLEVTELVKRSKEKSINFFAASMFASLQTVNSLQAFRLRIVEGEVRDYHVIHGGTTILRPDKSFSFCYYEFLPEASVFMKNMLREMESAKYGKDFDPADDRLDLIHYSSLPWVSFTNIKHACRIPNESSIPVLVFGKYFEKDGAYFLPFSLGAHHALVDGWHVGEYFELFQKNLDRVATD